ncbi:hypothetical protein [Streptomyces sp. NPDC054837]
MQPNNVSTLVTRLTLNGFIDRRSSAHDRRFMELHPAGKMITAGDEVNNVRAKRSPFAPLGHSRSGRAQPG